MAQITKDQTLGELKAQRDREYRDKRLMVAARLYAVEHANAELCVMEADITKANEEKAVPE